MGFYNLAISLSTRVSSQKERVVPGRPRCNERRLGFVRYVGLKHQIVHHLRDNHIFRLCTGGGRAYLIAGFPFRKRDVSREA